MVFGAKLGKNDGKPRKAKGSIQYSVLSIQYSEQSNGRRASADTDKNENTDSHGLRTQIF